MKYFVTLIIAISTSLWMIGCSKSTTIDETEEQIYSLEEGRNHVLLGPIRGATVSIYKPGDRTEHIYQTTTNKFGSFDVKGLASVEDDEVLLVVVEGGEDIDIDDDRKIDQIPTPFKGKLYGFATKQDLLEGRVNITIVSELVYLNMREIFPKESIKQDDLNINKSDLKKIITGYAMVLFPESQNEAYHKLLTFSPLNEEDRKSLAFDYDKLNSLIGSIHRKDLSVEDDTIDREIAMITGIPPLQKDDILALRDNVKVKLMLSDSVSIQELSGLDLDSQESGFVKKDQGFTIKVAVGDSDKILYWKGCDRVSDDKTECSVFGSLKDRLIMPFVVPKEIIINPDIQIRNISTAYIKYDKDNPNTIIIPISTLEQNVSVTLEKTEVGDILIHEIQPLLTEITPLFKKTVPIHFAKVTNITSTQDSYIIQVEKEDLFNIIQQGYMTTRIDPQNDYIKLLSKRIEFDSGQSITLDPRSQVSIDFNFVGDSIQVGIRDLKTREFVKDFEETFGIDGLKVEGNVTLKPEYDFGVSWQKWSIKPLKGIYFTSNVETEGNLKISFDKNASYEKDKELKQFEYSQKFTVFGIPVVTTEVITFKIGTKLYAEGNITVGASAYVNPTLDLGWTNDDDGAYCSLDIWNGFRYKYGAKVLAKTDDFAYFQVIPAAYLYGLGVKLDNKIGGYFEAEMNASLIQEDDKVPQNMKDLYSNIKIAAGLKGEYGIKYIAELRADSYKDKFKDATKWINNKIKDNNYLNYETKLWYKSFAYNYKFAKENAQEGNLTVETTDDDAPFAIRGSTIFCELAIENNRIGCGSDDMISFILGNNGEKKIGWQVVVDEKASNLFTVGINGNLNGSLSYGESTNIDLILELANPDIKFTHNSTGIVDIATINFCQTEPTSISRELEDVADIDLIRIPIFTDICPKDKKISYNIAVDIFSKEMMALQNQMNYTINSINIMPGSLQQNLNLQLELAGGSGYNPAGYHIYLSQLDAEGNMQGKVLIGTLDADATAFNAGNINSFISAGLVSEGNTYSVVVVPFTTTTDMKTGASTIMEADISSANSVTFHVYDNPDGGAQIVPTLYAH